MLSKHPELIPSIVEKFSQYPKEEKDFFAGALLKLNDRMALEKIQYFSLNNDKLLSIKSMDKLDLRSLTTGDQIKEIPQYVEYLWTAFEAKGDDKYILTILNYLAAEPMEIKIMASELANRMQLEKDKHRDNSDLLTIIKQFSSTQNQPYFSERVTIYQTVLMSLMSQRNHPAMAARIQELISKHPALDPFKSLGL